MYKEALQKSFLGMSPVIVFGSFVSGLHDWTAFLDISLENARFHYIFFFLVTNFKFEMELCLWDLKQFLL